MNATVAWSRERPFASAVQMAMVTFIALATLAMLGYMFWRTAFHMRRDRVLAKRALTKGKFAFPPRERLRFLLTRSFAVPQERPDWEEPLVSCLSRASREGRR